MTYVVQVWQPAADEAAPGSIHEAMRQLDAARDRVEPPRAKFETLLKRLTHRYPDITSRKAQRLPEDELAWSDGPLSAGKEPVLVLGLATSMCHEVQPFVAEQANKLGLNVADEQAGEVYLASGDLLSVREAEYEQLAQEGSVAAMRELAQMFLKGRGVRKDVRQTAFWYRKAAELGDAEAQLKLGLMFHDGIGVRRDPAEAVQWFRRSAELGYPGGQYELAVRLRQGVEGVAADPAEAFRWCSLAAAQGDGIALRVLGQMHQNGQGTAVDVQAAIRCYREATLKGSQMARLNLASLYAGGIGVPPDLAEAERIYKEGVRAGEASSMSGWATMLNRTGRPIDQPLMLALRIRAAHLDPAMHAGILEVLRERMPPSVVEKAEQLAQAEDIVAAIEASLRVSKA